MSKYIRIDVSLKAVYGSGGLRSGFPNLYKLLDSYGYTVVLRDEPDPYHLVDVLGRIRNDPAIPESVKKPIVSMQKQIVKVRDEARELLLSNRLSELDRKLYHLEDLLGDLDKGL